MPKLAYPVSPVSINQPFGANPAYYARFHDDFGNPEKGHMGVDLMAYHGQPIYAPCDGTAKWYVDEHGGEGFHIVTTQEDGIWEVVLWHMCSRNDSNYKPLLDTEHPVEVKIGQHLGYADNTGAPFESSGDHLHLGLIPIDPKGDPIYPRNGFNGAVDPLPYLSGSAVPAPKLPVATSVPYEQALASLQKSGLKGVVLNMAIAILKLKYGR